MQISLDLSPLKSISISSSSADDIASAVVRGVTLEIYRNWIAGAKQGLSKTRLQYTRGIQIVEEGPLKNSIVLIGTLNNMIEKGASAFDMKIGFSRSSKAVKTDKGWYLTIPFRFATPGAIGESEVFSNVMPKEIYEAVRKASSNKSTLGGSVSKGIGLKNVPKPYDQALFRSEFSSLQTKQTFDRYVHKTSIYAGMVRNEKTYEKATQGSYVTFRRASSKSDPMSWIHKGIVGKKFLESAVRSTDIRGVVDEIIEAMI